MEVVLGEKGRITLPAEIRRSLGLNEGDGLQLIAEGGAIVLRPKHLVTVDEVKGILGKHKVRPEEIEGALGAELD